MSNFLAIATVSAALQRLLQESVEVDVSGAKVTIDRPDAKRTGAIVNIFLYSVVPNPLLSNAELPSRRADGSVAQRPRTALDLHYLLTFHGDDKELEPQRLLGSALRTLATRPIVTKSLVGAVVAAAGAQPATHPSLADSDLGDAEEVPRLTPLTQDVEQMARLWAVFPQTAYALSSTWKASAVVIEADVTPLRPAPVVMSTLTVAPLGNPRIDRVETAADALEALTAGGTWRILGSQLVGDSTVVRVAGQTLNPTYASPSEMRVAVSPASSLRAGRVAVEVVHQALIGSPPSPHGELATALRTVSLCPRVLTASAAAGIVTVGTDIPVRTGQRVGLRLLVPATGEIAIVVPGPEPSADTTELRAAVEATAGEYAVVLTVDGADSPLQRTGSGAITAPLVTLS